MDAAPIQRCTTELIAEANDAVREHAQARQRMAQAITEAVDRLRQALPGEADHPHSN